MPDKDPARLEHTRELADHAHIVCRMSEEAKRREQVQYCVKALAPLARQLPHISPGVAKIGARPSSPSDGEQLRRIVEAIDVVAALCEQVCVTALTTWNVEDARADGQSQNVEQSRYLAPIAFRSKKRLVLEEIVGVKRGFPPLTAFLQKNTGSR